MPRRIPEAETLGSFCDLGEPITDRCWTCHERLANCRCEIADRAGDLDAHGDLPTFDEWRTPKQVN